MANGPNHINFVVRGTGDPTLTFVHGFACSLKDWEEQFRALSPRFRCVALDLPGHGDSAKRSAVRSCARNGIDGRHKPKAWLSRPSKSSRIWELAQKGIGGQQWVENASSAYPVLT